MVLLVRFASFLPALLVSLFFLPLAAAQGDTVSLVDDAEVPKTDPHPESDRWVEATLMIEQPDVTTMDITAFLTLRKYEIEGTDYSSADGISDVYHQLVQADAFAREKGQPANREENFVSDMEQSTTDALKSLLENAFPGANVSVEPATVDRSTFEEPDDSPFAPGVDVLVTARVVRTPQQVGLGSSTPDDLDALLDAGASITTTINLPTQTGYEITYLLSAPPGTAFTATRGASLLGGQIVAAIPYGSAPVPVALSMRGQNAPSYTASDASVDIVVDLKDLDVSIGQAVGGDFGNLLVELTVQADLGVIEVPDSLASGLPASVELDYLSSDAIRMLVERDLVTDADLAALEESLLKKVGDQLGGALGGDVTVTGGFDDASFAPGLIASPLSGDEPLVFHASASVVKPLAGGPIHSAAAISLYTTSLPLSLPKVQGLDTTYTVILPRGLAVTDLTATGGEYQASKAADGRDQFVVTPTDERADVTATMSVTPTFVMAKFWPVVLLAVLLLVLIVGTPVALVMRRKRKQA